MAAMPVFSSGQTGLQAHDTYAALGCADLIYAAGGGIFGHPRRRRRPASRRCAQSWDAAIAGVPLGRAGRASDRRAGRRRWSFWR